MRVFQCAEFAFPYKKITFPGQHSDEKILFVTREGKIMLYLKWFFVSLVGFVLFVLEHLLLNFVSQYIKLPTLLGPIITVLVSLGIVLAFCWFWLLWKKSVFIITTRRLTKFIYTTPFTRYQLSLGLDRIVDTGAYQKNYLQAVTKLGYFVARSAAGNIKNFKIINISFYEDLHNYVNKLLFTFNKEKEKLDMFRPFIPYLKGKARKEYVKKTAPEYMEE